MRWPASSCGKPRSAPMSGARSAASIAAPRSRYPVAASGSQAGATCGSSTALADGTSTLSAARATDVAFSCANFQGMFHTNKQILTSVDGGRLQQIAGRRAPMEGDNSGFAVPPGRPSVFIIAVVTPGQSYLARSANGGTSWTQLNVLHTTGGTNLSSLAFVSSNVGIVVVGGPGQLGKDGVYRTTSA